MRELFVTPKKNIRLRYPAELKKKALLELSESGNAEAVARHYTVKKKEQKCNSKLKHTTHLNCLCKAF